MIDILTGEVEEGELTPSSAGQEHDAREARGDCEEGRA
jgi:hypothetical protein